MFRRFYSILKTTLCAVVFAFFICGDVLASSSKVDWVCPNGTTINQSEDHDITVPTVAQQCGLPNDKRIWYCSKQLINTVYRTYSIGDTFAASDLPPVVTCYVANIVGYGSPDGAGWFVNYYNPNDSPAGYYFAEVVPNCDGNGCYSTDGDFLEQNILYWNHPQNGDIWSRSNFLTAATNNKGIRFFEMFNDPNNKIWNTNWFIDKENLNDLSKFYTLTPTMTYVRGGPRISLYCPNLSKTVQAVGIERRISNTGISAGYDLCKSSGSSPYNADNAEIWCKNKDDVNSEFEKLIEGLKLCEDLPLSESIPVGVVGICYDWECEVRPKYTIHFKNIKNTDKFGINCYGGLWLADFTEDFYLSSLGIGNQIRMVRDGYRFQGWCVYDAETTNGQDCSVDSPNFVANLCDDGADEYIIEPGSKGDKWVYAKWEPINYSIAYDTGDGECNANDYTGNNLLSYQPSTFTTSEDGITVTTDGRGTYIINGTANPTSDTYARVYIPINAITVPSSGMVAINNNQAFTNSEVLFQFYDDTAQRGGGYQANEINRHINFTSAAAIAGQTANRLCIAVKNGTTVTDLTISPALYGDDYAGDGTFAPGVNYESKCYPGTYNVESPGITLPKPVQDGYLFVGWCDETDQDCTPTSTTTTIPTGSTGNKKFYAKWEEIKCEKDTTVDSVGKPEVTESDIVKCPNVVCKAGYSKDGYMNIEGVNEENAFDVFGTEREGTVNVSCKPRTYHVKLDEPPANETPAEYWYVYTISKTFNDTKYWYWTKEIQSESDMTATNGSLEGIYIAVPEKKGHTFGGYNIKPDGTGTMYIGDDGNRKNNLYKNETTGDSTENEITLYAKWDLICDIRCNAGDYLPADETECDTCPVGSYCPGTTTDNNWCYSADRNQGLYQCSLKMGNNDTATTDGDGKSKATDCYVPCNDLTVEGNNTLVAEDDLHYDANYNANSSKCDYLLEIQYQKQSTDTSCNVSSCCPAGQQTIHNLAEYNQIETCTPDDTEVCPNGKYFNKWQVHTITFDSNSLKNTMVYIPECQNKKYTISYELNGGQCSETGCAPTEYTFGTGVAANGMPAPTKTGYTFGGWYDKDNNLVESITETDLGDKKLFASWKIACEAGTYLPANGSTCAVCKQHHFCEGFTDPVVVPSTEDTGIKSCSDETDGKFPSTWSCIERNDNNVCTKGASAVTQCQGTVNLHIDDDTLQQVGARYQDSDGYSNSCAYDNNTKRLCKSNKNNYMLTDGVGSSPTTVFSKAAYDFVGWYKESNFATLVSDTNTFTGNQDFYAKWTPTTYKITYDAVGGTCAENTQQSPNLLSYQPNGWKNTVNGITITSKGNGKYTINGNRTDTSAHDTRLIIPINEIVVPYAVAATNNTKGSGSLALYNDKSFNSDGVWFEFFKDENQVSNGLGLTAVNSFKNNWIWQGAADAQMGGKRANKMSINVHNVATITNLTIQPALYNDFRTSAGTFAAGPTFGCAEQIYNIESEEIVLPTPVKEGYTFDGWYNDNKKITKIPAGTSGNITLTAHWTPQYGTVNFVCSPTYTYPVTDKQVGENVYWPTKTECNNTETETWSCSGGNSDEVRDVDGNVLGIKIKSDRTITCKPGYRIEYRNPPTGTVDDEILVYGQPLNPRAYTSDIRTYYPTVKTMNSLPIGVSAGYKFVGWFSDEYLTHGVDRLAVRSSGKKIVYAKWESVPKCIVGDGVETTEAFITDDIVKCHVTCKDGYSKNGYHDTTVTFDTNEITQDRTVSCSARTYKINFDPRYYADVNSDAVANSPTKPGLTTVWYRYKQFTPDPDNTVQNTGCNCSIYPFPTNGLSKECYYYKTDIRSAADETLDNCVLRGASNNTCETQCYAYIGLGSLPTYKGYTFDGYFANKAGTETQYTNQYGTFIGDVYETLPTDADKALDSTGTSRTLYAKWTPAEYSVDYKVKNNGAWESLTGLTPATYTVESAEDQRILPSITRNGYTFAGWYNNSDLTGNAVEKIANGATGKQTFYAKWTPKPITCTGGKYIAANSEVCEENCPADHYCPAATYEYTGEEQGKYSCATETENGFTKSDAESDAITACYKDITTQCEDVYPCPAHATCQLSGPESISGKQYYGQTEVDYDGAECVKPTVTVCEAGWNVNATHDACDKHIKYKIKFMDCGATSGTPMADLPATGYITFGENTDYFLPDADHTSYSKSNYTFTQWCKAKESGATSVCDGDDRFDVGASTDVLVDDDMANEGTINICPDWQPKDYTINYYNYMDSDLIVDGVLFPQTESYNVTTQSPKDLKSDVESVLGYEFKGWCSYNEQQPNIETAADCPNPILALTFNANDIGDKYMYAKWTPKNITCDGGKYIAAGSEECTELCPRNYYCPADEYTYNGEEQGKYSCATETENGFTKSASKSEAKTACYKKCLQRDNAQLVAEKVYWSAESEEQADCEYVFNCDSGKWLHIGNDENDKMCLYVNKPDAPVLGLAIKSENSTINKYYAKLSEDSDVTINAGSSKKMRVKFGTKTYNVHDASVNANTH